MTLVEKLLATVRDDGRAGYGDISLTVIGEAFNLEIGDEQWSGLSERELRNRLEAAPTYLENWGYWHGLRQEVPAAGITFLRWLERAGDWSLKTRRSHLEEGITRTWGQLSIRTSLRDSVRSYDLRHEVDRGRTPSELDRYDDPRALREIRRYTDDRSYRPLTGAPSLRAGWTVPELSGADLITGVESVYPAGIANWARERADDLDVTHWTQTAARQTGIYEVVSELPERELQWVVEACCTDDACLKRRTWDWDADETIDVDRGTGRIPCREPCSLIVAAAREVARSEIDADKPGENTLSTGDREQLLAILEALADDRIDDIRVGDVREPANRLRRRYLAAKSAALSPSED